MDLAGALSPWHIFLSSQKKNLLTVAEAAFQLPQRKSQENYRQLGPDILKSVNQYQHLPNSDLFTVIEK
jgi:hypothetical protein